MCPPNEEREGKKKGIEVITQVSNVIALLMNGPNQVTFIIILTSGCPWLKATVKSPVGARRRPL